MKNIEIIHQEEEVQFANFTNDYLNHDEMSKITGAQADGLFCRTKKNCDDYTGACTRISCGQWRESAA